MRLAIFYTGDIRHNTDLTYKNHNLLFEKIKKIIPIDIYYFTRNDPNRGICPYDPPDQIDPDNVYRRGQGGAVQVWDFLRGVQRTSESYVLRLRTDLWFTESAMTTICDEINKMIAGESDICYFGSDWINENAGAINNRLPVHIDIDNTIQDFVVLAARDKLKSFDQCVIDINSTNPNKRRSGNKIFRYIIPIDKNENGVRTQYAKTFRVLCQIWLVRKDYSEYPSDHEVCKDYIQSYIVDNKAKAGKKNLIYPHPMQDAVNWWRAQHGWKPKEVTIGDWWSWQSQ